MKKKNIIELLIIIALGFIPLLWFHGSQVILGHDSGLTLSPIPHFTDRLFAWTERFGFGNDQTYAIAGFFIHGLDAFISSLGQSLQNVEKTAFIFWILLPGLTMYYLSSKLAKKFNLKYFALPATVFYMFNHFLLQGWFVAERTKFSVYAALPLVMGLLFDWEENQRSTLKTALFISVILFILNGEASLPLFGGIILSVLTFVIFFFIKEFSKERIYQILKLFGIVFIVSIFLNAYWLFPYGGYLLQSYGNAVAQAGGLNGVLGWLNYVSGDASFINIFRLQGIPEWYLNPQHPYAGIFLNNVFLIAFSFLIPIGAFLPLHIIKDKKLRKEVIFFSFLVLISMILMAGSHPPFGSLYVLLVNFVPGFIAFRNPFYKFAPALWLSYSILLAFTVDYFLKKIELREDLKKISANFIYLLIPVIIVLYSFPFLNGSFFDYVLGVRSTRVNVPQYVLDFGKWSDSKDRINTKVLALPSPNLDNKIDGYTWGYWSPSPITSLLTNASIINESNYMSDKEIGLVETFYRMMRNDEPGWQNMAKILGIKSFLLRKDFDWNSDTSPTNNPSDYGKALRDPGVTLTKKFGEWEVYDLKDTNIPEVQVSSGINYLMGDTTDLGKLSSLPNFNPNEETYVSSTHADNQNELLNISNNLFLASSCVSCNLQHKFIDLELFRPLITRDSLFYFLMDFKNKLAEKKLSSSSEKANYYLYQSLREMLALDKMVSEKKDMEIIKSQIRAYGDVLEKLGKPVSNYLAGNNVDNSFVLELGNVLRTEDVIILTDYSNIPDKAATELLNEQYKVLLSMGDKIDKKAWETKDEVNKKFIVISNTNQKFDAFYRSNYVSTHSAISSLNIDGRNYDIAGGINGAGWITLGSFDLSKGLHKISISQPTENLYNGPSSTQLNSSSNFYCFSSNKIKGNRNDVYRVSFEHRRLSGSRKFFTKIISSKTKPNPFDSSSDVLNSASVWDGYTTEYMLNDDGSFYLTICNRPTTDIESFVSTIEIRNINIRKLITPDLVFYQSNSSENKLTGSFIKKDQTEYSVSSNYSGAKAIMLRESYNSNWILSGSESGNKFVANGYANGWVVNDKNKITIKYRLQDMVKWGFIVAGICFGSILFYLLLKIRKK